MHQFMDFWESKNPKLYKAGIVIVINQEILILSGHNLFKIKTLKIKILL